MLLSPCDVCGRNQPDDSNGRTATNSDLSNSAEELAKENVSLASASVRFREEQTESKRRMRDLEAEVSRLRQLLSFHSKDEGRASESTAAHDKLWEQLITQEVKPSARSDASPSVNCSSTRLLRAALTALGNPSGVVQVAAALFLPDPQPRLSSPDRDPAPPQRGQGPQAGERAAPQTGSTLSQALDVILISSLRSFWRSDLLVSCRACSCRTARASADISGPRTSRFWH